MIESFCKKLSDLGWHVSYQSSYDRSGEYWKVTATNRTTKQTKTAVDKMFARSIEPLCEKIYNRIIGAK